jgi:beta-glucosidase
MRIRKERHFTGTRCPEITEREVRNRAVARRAAAEGIVLLENKKHLLPLKKGEKVALFGVGASKTIKGGTGSGDVNERESVSIFQGMKNAGFQITTEEWIRDFDGCYKAARNAWRDDILRRAEETEGTLEFFRIYSRTPFVMPAGGPVAKTEADIAIFVLSRVAGEGKDRNSGAGDYKLTEEEKQQLADICAFYAHVVVAVNTGGLVDLSFMEEHSNIEALLYIVQPGMEGGNAFADVISGAVTPSGKLTDSWAYQYEDYPNSTTFSGNNKNVEEEFYAEGIYVGYRYFDTFDVPVRYSFGYGQSYTDFKTEHVSIKWDNKRKDIVVTARVTNIGTVCGGKEVVELYVTPPEGRMEKEFRRLVGFAKTALLSPSESEEVTIEVSAEGLASYCEEIPGWVLEKGEYVFWLGNSLDSAVLAAMAVLEKDIILTRTKHIAPVQKELRELKQDTGIMQKKRKAMAVFMADKNLPTAKIPADHVQREIIYRENKDFISREASAFVDTLSVEQLIALASGDPGKAQGGNLGAAGISVPGSAGETNNCALDKNLASIVLADGPAGLRLMKYYNVEDGKILSKPFSFSLEGGIFCPDTGDEPGDRYYQYCTAIPVGTLLAQTWDCGLIREVGRMVGGEMEEFGVTLWLAPGMNIHRNPLCGRNFEYYAEDPLLAGKIAAAMTDGVQSTPGCGTTIKHLTCNNQEDNRMGSDSIVSERALREIYLRGFEIAVKESQPMSIMTSYNLLNGVHVANNRDICTDVVRSEWGFAGMIMTDWTTTEHGADCTASGCMRAGNDLVMPGAFCDKENLERELREGTLKEEDLKACISRLVHIIWQSNQYEGAVPYKA